MSGYQNTQQLRDQLKRLQEEYEHFKVKTAKDYETMQAELGVKS